MSKGKKIILLSLAALLLITSSLFVWAKYSGKIIGWADSLLGRNPKIEDPFKKEPKIKFVTGELVVKVKSEVTTKGVSPEQSLKELNLKFGVTKSEKVITNVKEKSVKTQGISQQGHNFNNILKLTFPIKTEKVKDLNQEKAKKEYLEIHNNLISKYKGQKFSNEELYTLSVISEYGRNSQVEYVEPNYIYDYQMTPNDPYYPSKGSWGQDYDE